MKNKFKVLAASVVGALSLVIASLAGAAVSPIVVPTSTASDMLANVSSIITDPGMLTILEVVAGLYVAFWFIKRLIGLVPKSK